MFWKVSYGDGGCIVGFWTGFSTYKSTGFVRMAALYTCLKMTVCYSQLVATQL